MNKDWVEDFEHENGQYQNMCLGCSAIFLGHKRRHFCKQCADDHILKYNEMTDEEKTIALDSVYQQLKDFYTKNSV